MLISALLVQRYLGVYEEAGWLSTLTSGWRREECQDLYPGPRLAPAWPSLDPGHGFNRAERGATAADADTD